MIPVITLDDGEMQVCRMVAQMRHSAARLANVTDAKVGNQSGYETDLIGMVAEVAFSKWRNTYPDLSIKPRSGGVDAIVNGRKVEVKATTRKNGRLLATLDKADKDGAEYYALAIVDGNVVTFPGYATARELLRKENIRDLGHGSGYAMEQSELHEFSDHLAHSA